MNVIIDEVAKRAFEICDKFGIMHPSHREMFACGYRYGLRTNLWHKTSEELPKELKYVENTMQGRREWTESEQVLVINNHYQKSVDYLKNGKWVRLRDLPKDCDGFKTCYLYWMPIPELKED